MFTKGDLIRLLFVLAALSFLVLYPISKVEGHTNITFSGIRG